MRRLSEAGNKKPRQSEKDGARLRNARQAVAPARDGTLQQTAHQRSREIIRIAERVRRATG